MGRGVTSAHARLSLVLDSGAEPEMSLPMGHDVVWVWSPETSEDGHVKIELEWLISTGMRSFDISVQSKMFLEGVLIYPMHSFPCVEFDCFTRTRWCR